MRKIFHWFYCLPILDAVLLIVLVTGVFLLLQKQFEDTQCWKIGLAILFTCWIGVILFGTLAQRTTGANLSDPILTPFHSYYTAMHGGSQELYRANFMNAVLFYPTGLFGLALLPRQWRKIRNTILLTAVFAMLSICIEFSQYHFGLGLAEVDDVIHNTMGTLLGAIACNAPIQFHK